LRESIFDLRFFYDHFHFDVLKRELFVDHPQELESASIRHLRTTHFDPRLFTGKLRMRFGHFAIEQERNISVKSLLQLVKLRT